MNKIQSLLKMPFKIVMILLAVVLSTWSVNQIIETRKIQTENNFQAGSNTIERMMNVEGLTTFPEAVEFFQLNSSNKTFMQQSCADGDATTLLKMVYGENNIKEVCRAANTKTI